MIAPRKLRLVFGLLLVLALSVVTSADSLADPCPSCPPSPTPLVCPTANPLSNLTESHEGDQDVGVGKIPDAFSISSTGEAVYSLKLDVPPGRQGMEPHLSLSYNSASGDGALG